MGKDNQKQGEEMSHPIDVSRWEIIRCLYTPMGMGCNEVEEPERFAKCADEYGEYGEFIGEIREANGKKYAPVFLEGKKEILEYVLCKLQEGGKPRRVLKSFG